MLYPLTAIQKIVLTQVIAPHGITDIIHAHKTNSYGKMLNYYGGSVIVSSSLEHLHQTELLNLIFFIASSYHFRHDLKRLFPTLPYSTLFSGSTLYLLVQNPQLFFFYMTCVHVPNHYTMVWKHIKEFKKETFFLVACTGIISLLGYNWMEKTNILPLDLIMGIVLGHIFYEETVISDD